MSYTFSRRTFFKYSLTAAAALAGTSLLGGCGSAQDPYNPKRTELGSIENMLITAKLESFDMTSGDFKLSLKSERGNPETFDQYCIAVKVLDEEKKAISYYDGNALSFTIESGFLNRPLLKTNDEAVFNFKIKGFAPVQPGQTVRLQYIPVSDKPTYSMIWELTNPKEETGDSDSTTTK